MVVVVALAACEDDEEGRWREYVGAVCGRKRWPSGRDLLVKPC